MDDEIESILYIAREISGAQAVRTVDIDKWRWTVYKIPPLKANEGHRANDWGDLAVPLWKGRLRIIEKGKDVSLRFEDANTGLSSPSHPLALPSLR